MQYLSFSVLLISLSIMTTRFIYGIASTRISYIFKTEYLYLYISHFVYPLIHYRHFFFHLLYIVTAMSMYTQISELLLTLGYIIYPEMKFWDHKEILCLIFKRDLFIDYNIFPVVHCYSVSIPAHIIYYSKARLHVPCFPVVCSLLL